MTATEALKTFNCGVGYVLIVPPASVTAVQKEFDLYGWHVQHLGILEPNRSSGISLHYNLIEM